MGIEPLERRRLLAGVVYVVEEDEKTQGLSGGQGPVDVTIGFAADKNRNYVLADNLIVDGQPFTDGRYFIRKPNLYVTLSGYDDTLRIKGGRFDRTILSLNGGNDLVEWDVARDGISQFNTVTLNLDEGEDRLFADNLTIADQLTITGGSGQDRYEFAGTTNVPTLLLEDLRGASKVSLAGAAIDRLGLRTGNSIDRVAISGGYIHDSLKLQTGGGNDVVSLTNYEAPPAGQFVVDAGAGMNQVTDTRLAGTPTIGRIEAVFSRGTGGVKKLAIFGHGPSKLSFKANYGSMEESAGTYVDTNVPIYVDGVRQKVFLLDRVPQLSKIDVRMDDADQTVNVNFDGFLFGPPKLDIATAGGDDVVGVTDTRAFIGIDTGRGDDFVGLAADSTSIVRLGAGRDGVEVIAGQQVNIYDTSGPATITVESAKIAGGLYIETSDSIDRVTLKNVVATRLGLRLGGGADVLSETDVRVIKRNVDLGPQ